MKLSGKLCGVVYREHRAEDSSPISGLEDSSAVLMVEQIPSGVNNVAENESGGVPDGNRVTGTEMRGAIDGSREA